MAFQSPQQNIGIQIAIILAIFSVICLGTSAVFNMSSGKAISVRMDEPGQLIQSFESPKKNQVYFVRLKSNTGRLPYNSGWSRASVEVATEDDQTLFAFGGDFWRAQGRDSDGAWNERKNLNKMKITLRESGTFNLKVDYESSVRDPGQLTIILQPKRASSLPFFWLGVLSFVGAIVVGYFASKSLINEKIGGAINRAIDEL